jgi:hypothetical protein
MVLKTEIEMREAQCATPQDYADLAEEALVEPADKEYAKQLLRKGEMQCQLPADYIKIAEVTLAAGDPESADSLFQQAQEFCMQSSEFAELAYSLAKYTDQKEKARGLLQKAVESADKPQEVLAYAGYAKSVFDDDALAASLITQVKGQLKDLEDYKRLVQTLIDENQDKETARMLYQQAADLGSEIADRIAYAKGSLELFGDTAEAEERLAAMEEDCMFPGQFVVLAEGYKQLLEKDDKVAELLERGKEFAMSGEENHDLANGYARLTEEEESARDLYTQALNDYSAKDDLIRLASDILKNLKDNALATQVYEKAEGKISSAKELAELAKTVHERLGDKAFATAIFDRVAEKFDQPNDLLNLGGDVFTTLADHPRTSAIYRRVLQGAQDYPPLRKLLDILGSSFDDMSLAEDTVQRVMNLSEDTQTLLDLASRADKVLGNAQRTGEILDKAEESVSSLDEMRHVVNLVKQLVADDEQRIQRVETKLEKREASQAIYTAFQAREKQLTRSDEFIALSGAVIEELQDSYYAAQLLTKAQDILDARAFELSSYLGLVKAVDRLIGDAGWLKRLLDHCAGEVMQFTQVRMLGQTATFGLTDEAFGRDWTKAFYKLWEEKLLSRKTVTSSELGKLARVLRSDLGEESWALELLEKARQQADSPLGLVWLGYFARTWGESEKAESLYHDAAAKCEKADEFGQIARQLRDFQEAEQLRKALYTKGEQALTDKFAKLRWAEGIVREFGDQQWAGKVYEELKGLFEGGEHHAIYNYSYRYWLKGNPLMNH